MSTFYVTCLGDVASGFLPSNESYISVVVLFNSYEDAQEYARGIHPNREPKVLVEAGPPAAHVIHMPSVEASVTRTRTKITLKRLEECMELAKGIGGEDPDVEVAHVQADAALCALLTSLGYEEVAEAWAAIPKWYA